MQVSRVFRDILAVFSSNIFAILAGLGSGIMISRVLGPDGRGLFAALITVPMLVISFGALGLRRSALFHISSPEYDNNKVISSLLVLWLFSSVIGSGAAAIMYSGWDTEVYTVNMILPVILVIPLELVISYTGGLYLGIEDFKMVNRIRISKPLFFLFYLTISLIILDLGIDGVAWAYLLASFSVAIGSTYITKKNFKFNFTWDYSYVKKMLRLGIQFALAFFVVQLNLRLDTLLLKEWSTTDQVGFYSVASTVAEQLWQLPMAIGIVVASKTASVESREEMKRKLGPLLRLSILVGTIGALALFILIPFLLPLVYGEDFAPSIPAVRIILPGVVMFMIFRILNSRLDGFGKPVIGILITIPGFILNVILNYFLIPEYGAYGAAVATDISYTLVAVLMVVGYSRVAQVSISSLLKFRKSDFEWLRILLNSRFVKQIRGK